MSIITKTIEDKDGNIIIPKTRSTAVYMESEATLEETVGFLYDLTATAQELNVLYGVPSTLTATELGYVDGVTSPIQAQINTKSNLSTVTTASLVAATWTGATAPYSYLLPVSGITATSNQEVLPTTTITAAELAQLQAANIIDGGQSTDLFVAINTNSTTINTSMDGINWVANTSALSNYVWTSICYGNGMYVAICSGSYISGYSYDGITWSAGVLPAKIGYQKVCYGNGRFVTISNGSSNASAYSTDGITFIASTLPSSADWVSIAFGAGKFVAVATGRIAYSTDGIAWTQVTIPNNPADIVYGADKFVVITSVALNGSYSTDGMTWYNTTQSSADGWYRIAYGNGIYVAMTNFDTMAMRSTDGITWYPVTLPVSREWRAIAYGNGKFVMIANGTTEYIYSTTGATGEWVTTALASSLNWITLTCGDAEANLKLLAYGTKPTIALPIRVIKRGDMA